MSVAVFKALITATPASRTLRRPHDPNPRGAGLGWSTTELRSRVAAAFRLATADCSNFAYSSNSSPRPVWEIIDEIQPRARGPGYRFSNSTRRTTNMQHFELLIGRRKTGVTVRPDPLHSGVWRVHDGDRVSDMVNIDRAKDAAIIWACPRGLGGYIAHWHMRETAAEASYSAPIQSAAA
jgi:hypothetical protein